MATVAEQARLLPTVTDMHKGLEQIVSERLPFEPVFLVARVGMGASNLAASMAADLNGVTVDPLLAGSDSEDLAAAIAKTLIAREFARPLNLLASPDPEAMRALARLAELYGQDLELALDIATGTARPNESGWNIARAFGHTLSGGLLVVDHAHRLTPRTLWELRDLAGAGLRLLLLSTPEHQNRLRGKEAAFYGFGAYMEMPTLGLPVWTAKLGSDTDGLAISELFRQSLGRTEVMLEVLARRTPEDKDLGSAWFRTIDSFEHEARTVMALAPTIHALAPAVLMAVAHNERPYAGDDRPDRVALALRHLRNLDLVEQPEPRRWQIADPRLAAALRRLRPGWVEVYPGM